MGMDMILIPVLVYIGVVAFALLRSERMIFVPHPPDGKYENTFAFTASDGTALRGRHMPNDDAVFTILYSHGNAEDLVDIEPSLKELHDWGFAVFSYDYRGYGLSEGIPSVEGTYKDVAAAHRYLTGTLGVPPDRIIVLGRSVGGGPSTYLAETHPVAGLVLQSTFLSTYRVMTRYPLLPFDKFPNIRRIKKLHIPILVIHGTRDGVIPFHHGEGLFRTANEPKQSLWLDGAGHNFMSDEHTELLRQALCEFADKIPRPPQEQ